MTERGRRPYDCVEHRRLRARWRHVIDRGDGWCSEYICLMPSRYIAPGSAWHLAHDRDNGGYLGPAHAKCNASEGAAFGNRLRGRQWWP